MSVAVTCDKSVVPMDPGGEDFESKALGNYASNLALTYFFIILNKIINMQRTINVNAVK